MKKILLSLVAALCCATMFATEGALSGKFTINAAGDQIVFSQGNLQYQPSTSTWRLAEHQWSFVGWDFHSTSLEDNLGGNVYIGDTKCNNNDISDTYEGWIDMFGFGTGDAPTKVSYDANDYMTYTEWGSNAISNGGNQADCWRTLHTLEWNYLFYGRENANKLFAFGKVNGEDGLIILPDDWTLPEGQNFNPSTENGLYDENSLGRRYYTNDSRNNYTHNTYNLEQWNVMEAAGAVFLPAARQRFKEHVDDRPDAFGSFGSYWSSANAAGDDNPPIEYGMYVSFSQIDLWPLTMIQVYYGCSVRLVQAPTQSTEAINNTAAGSQTSKRIVNGQLLIEKSGKTYNAVGAEIR